MTFNKPPQMANFVWWQGVVESVNDPEKLGRCKVRILGYHTEDKATLPTSDLPWAYPLQPITSAAMSGIGTSPTGLLPGSWVIGFFQDGEYAQHPVIMGSFGGINSEDDQSGDIGFRDPKGKYPKASYKGKADTNKLARGEELRETILSKKLNDLEMNVPTAIKGNWHEPATDYRAVYPHNKVTETESGHVFEVDDTPDHERIHVYHKSGTFKEIFPDGKQVEKVVGSNYQIIKGSDRKMVYGESSINTEGDFKLSAKGNLNIQIAGDEVNIYTPATAKVSLHTGTFYHHVRGKYILNADGIILNSSTLDINNPLFNTPARILSKLSGFGKLKPNYPFPPGAKLAEAVLDLETKKAILFTENGINQAIADELGVAVEEVLESGALEFVGEAVTDAVEDLVENTVDAAASSALATIPPVDTGEIVGSITENIKVVEDVMNQVGAGIDTFCSIAALIQAMEDLEIANPADIFDKLGEMIQPLGDIPSLIGEAIEGAVEAAVDMAVAYVEELARPFLEIAESVGNMISSVEGALTDPCGSGGAGAAGGAGGLESNSASPGAVSGMLGMDEFQYADLVIDTQAGVISDIAATTKDIRVPVVGTIFASQASARIGGLESLTLPTLGIAAGLAGLGLGLAALFGDDGSGLPSLGGGPVVPGGGGGPVVPGGGGLFETTWTSPEPTSATNIEGIPTGTVIPLGSNAVQILEKILYPKFLGFPTFTIGIPSGPYHVGFATAANQYLAEWTIQDVEEAVENSIQIDQGNQTLISNLPLDTVNISIQHQAYTLQEEGSVKFTISLLSQGGNIVSSDYSLNWRYPVYTGKFGTLGISESNITDLKVTTNPSSGKNPFVNYTISSLRSGVTIEYPNTSSPEYMYFLVPKSVDGTAIPNYPQYDPLADFVNVTSPNQPIIIPMVLENYTIEKTAYELTTVFDVYRSDVPFVGGVKVKISQS
jgi:hypothetical protein